MTFTWRTSAAIRWACVFLSFATAAFASSRQASAEARKYAVIIGVSFCEDDTAAPLPFVENDVAIVAESLAKSGFTVYPFCEASVKFDSLPLSQNARRNIKRSQPPTKKNVEAAFTDVDEGPCATSSAITKRRCSFTLAGTDASRRTRRSARGFLCATRTATI